MAKPDYTIDIEANIRSGKYETKLEYPSGMPKGPERLELLRKRNLDGSRLTHTVFRDDLFASYGVQDNPKAQKCFDIAWDIGHSNGLHEVHNYFDTLVELIK